MHGFTLSIRRLLTRSAVGLFMLLNMAGGAAVVPAVAAAATSGHLIPAVGVNPQYHLATRAPQGAQDILFSCQVPGTAFPCYGPKQIQVAYDIQPLLNAGITGKGRTIVIVDAFQNPFIQTDLAAFDSTFGLNDPTLNIIAPDGLTPFDITSNDQIGWSAEIALDVQYAHAVAPDATIDLVLAKSDQDADILSATKFAITHNLGDTISQSFGEDESCVDPQILKQEHDLFALATLEGMTLFASSGDDGASLPTCDGSSFTLAASSPATDPLVTAVGGTSLNANPDTGVYSSETAWDGSGGGFSVIYPRPVYQIGATGKQKGRGEPDVADVADPNTGVLIHFGVGNELFGFDPTDPNIFFQIGGTSAGSPQWAGIAALGAQKAHHRLGLINPTVYAILHNPFFYGKDFHDITTGNNIVDGLGGFNAGKGWDPVTGVGTPDVANLLSFPW